RDDLPWLRTHGSTLTCRLVPGTAVGARPLQHLEMASLGCVPARPLVPGTAVGPRPLEQSAASRLLLFFNTDRPHVFRKIYIVCVWVSKRFGFGALFQEQISQI